MKMVAEVLKISPDRVSMAPTDSLTNPNEFGPAGSRGTYAIGSAVINAAEDARKKLFDQLAPKLKANPNDLDTEDGFVFAKGNPDKRMPWTAMGHDRTITGFGFFKPDFTLSNCVINFVEIEVDMETGKTTLLRVVAATDVGKIIDPPGLEAQLNGCLGSGGIDSAIFEETVLDHSTGYILNANLIDYKWRTSRELPVIDHAILETPIDSHRFYAIGIGEITTSPGPSAVQMAVSNAIGKWFSEYPVTPERLLKIIGEQNKSEGEQP
jgi:xanthine dehydrogenase molybdenum-binding subunit